MRTMLSLIHLAIGAAILLIARSMTGAGAEVNGKFAAFVAILLIVGAIGWAMGRDVGLWLLLGANLAVMLFAIGLCFMGIARLLQPLPPPGARDELEPLNRVVFMTAAVLTLVTPAALTWALIRDAFRSHRDAVRD